MKQPPKYGKIQEMMQPGRLTRDGMLGHDRRSLEEILEADQSTVNRLGLTHKHIAGRLAEFTRAARERLGDRVTLEGTYEVHVFEARGMLPCPFSHPGRCPKIVTYLKHLPTGEELQWTSLATHMIAEHGFYGGHGAPYRLNPERVATLLDLQPTSGI